MLIEWSYRYSGDISFTLAGGPKITLSNDQLVVPNQVIGGTGIAAFNSSQREILIAGTFGSDPIDITYLGQPFFTAAYMMVEPNTFTIWQSVPTTNSDLISICDSEVAPGVTSTTTQTVTTTTGKGSAKSTTKLNIASSTALPDPVHHGLSSGTSAGITVAAIAATVCVLALLYYIRKNMKRKQGVLQHQTSLQELNKDSDNWDQPLPPYERQELPAETIPLEMLSGYTGAKLSSFGSHSTSNSHSRLSIPQRHELE